MSQPPVSFVKRVLVYLLTLVLLGSLCLSFPAPAQAGGSWLDYIGRQIALRFNPPRGPSPNRRSGGFGRGDTCLVDIDLPLTALAIEPLYKQTKENPPVGRLNYVGGETTEASPTLWFYTPYTRSQGEGFARFMLLDEFNKPVFENPIKLFLPESPGIISVSLPQQHSLLVEKPYFWYFSVICNLDRPSRNPSVNGWIRRVPSEPGQEPGKPDESNLAWYDLLNTLASARRQSPSKIDSQRYWDLLMRSNKGLEKLAQKEISRCCVIENGV